jgi:2-keto-3-deoxy-L-rhamnonate aldolase RhmA
MPLADFTNPLRAKFKSNRPAFGLWVTLETPTVTEIAAELGLDWVCIDMEHGCLDYKDVVQHVRAAKGSDTTVVVRVPAITIDTIKRCLDLGTDGVLLPLVRSAGDLEEGMQYARYPGRGVRGIGGERSMRWGLKLEEYVALANRETLVIPLIETAQASDNMTDILAVPGLEAIFMGPADLSSSRGYLGQWEGPGVAEDILRILELARDAGIATGIMATDNDDITRRSEQGFHMVGLGSDIGMILRQLRPTIKDLGGREFARRWF